MATIFLYVCIEEEVEFLNKIVALGKEHEKVIIKLENK